MRGGAGSKLRTLPVDLELAVCVLVVGLVRAPAEVPDVSHQLGDDLVSPHERLLVVAGFGLRVVKVADGVCRWVLKPPKLQSAAGSAN